MNVFKRFFRLPLLFCTVLNVSIAQASAQGNVLTDKRYDSVLLIRQREALALLKGEDTVSASPFFPNVKPKLFFRNVRMNILFPGKINQGASTCFCGYAAMTHLLLKYNPRIYIKAVISLYRTGAASLKDKKLQPSEAVRRTAGTLKHKGELDVLHADQLWFLSLADQFKGYVNVVNQHYSPGDENSIWAGTNYGKFNRMLEDFTDHELTTAGSDFLRPFTNDFYDYITRQLQAGVVLLYVNGKFLSPHKMTLFKMRSPTHFIVLYNMRQAGDMIEIQYWDYGLRTQQLITQKRLRKLIFGITTIKMD